MKTLLALFTSLLSLGAFAQPYTINVGSAANDNTGDTIRSALIKVNSNTVYFASQSAATNRVAVNSGVATNLSINGASVSTVTNSDLTASRVMVLDSAKRQTNSTVTAAELLYLGGVTSGVQAQLDSKLSSSSTAFVASLNGSATNVSANGFTGSGTVTIPTFTGASEFLSTLTVDGILKNSSTGGFDIGASTGRWRVDHNGTAPYEYRFLGSDNAAHGIIVSDVQATSSIRFATDYNKVIVIDGDSLNSNSVDRWSRSFLNTYKEFGSYTASFVSVPGSTAADAVSRYAANVTTLVTTNQTRRIYSIRTGINSLIAGVTANSIYADLKTLWANARADGFEVWAWTVMPSTSCTGGNETARASLNAFILSDMSLYDKVIDVAKVMTDASNVTYFADGTHPTTTGASVEAALAYNSVAVRGIIMIPSQTASWNTSMTNMIPVLGPAIAGGGAVQIGNDVGSFTLGRRYGKQRMDAQGSGTQPFEFLGTDDNYTGTRMAQLSVGLTAGDAPANGISTAGIIRQTQTGGISLGADTGHNRIDANGTAGAWRFLNTANAGATVGMGSLTIGGAFIQTPSALSSSVDWSAGNTFTKTLAADTTFTFSNSTSGQEIKVILTQGASAWTVTWPTVKWASGSAPTMTATSGKKDVYRFLYDGTDYLGWYQQNF